MENDAFAPARLRDRAVIEDVLLRWARGVDRLDAQPIRDAFHADAADDHGPYSGGIEGFIDYLLAKHVGAIPKAVHAISNIVIDFAAADVAIAECRFMIFQSDWLTPELAPAGGTRDMIAAGRYIDRFERRAGDWRIAHRTAISDWSRILPPAEGPPRVTPFVQGVRGPGDFLYEALSRIAG